LTLAKTKPGKGLTLLEFAVPVPGPDEVLIKIAASGICGSDVHIYEWAPGYEWIADAMPLIPGHEVAGIVVGRGAEVTGFALGDGVVCLPGAGCGKCELCRRGLIAVCAAKRQIGLHRHGAFAEYVAVPAAACVSLPKNMNLVLAALTEPLTVSLRAVKRAGDLQGKNVAVMGAGTIGLGVAHFASVAQARVWLFGKEQDQAKYKIAESLGATGWVNVDRENLQAAGERITGKQGFDVVFDCTGVSSLIQKCFELTRIAGQVVAVGIYPAPVQINLRDMVRQEKNLITSYGYTRSIFEEVIARISQADGYQNLITHTYKLEDGLEAMELAARRTAGKIMLRP